MEIKSTHNAEEKEHNKTAKRKKPATKLLKKLLTCCCDYSSATCPVHEPNQTISLDLSFLNIDGKETDTIKEQVLCQKFQTLQTLNLSHNSLKSLEFLSLWPISQCLAILNLNYNFLDSLEGVQFLENLKVLRCVGNHIECLEQVQCLTSLDELWLAKNDIGIRELYRLQPLAVLTKLLLSPNPCNENPNCRYFAIQMLPAIVNLDGQNVTVKERTASFNFLQSTEGKVLLHQARSNMSAAMNHGRKARALANPRLNLAARNFAGLERSTGPQKSAKERRLNFTKRQTEERPRTMSMGVERQRNLSDESEVHRHSEAAYAAESGQNSGRVISKSDGGSPRQRRRRRRQHAWPQGATDQNQEMGEDALVDLEKTTEGMSIADAVGGLGGGIFNRQALQTKRSGGPGRGKGKGRGRGGTGSAWPPTKGKELQVDGEHQSASVLHTTEKVESVILENTNDEESDKASFKFPDHPRIPGYPSIDAKNYPSGNLAVSMHSDGTGFCKYPKGSNAISIDWGMSGHRKTVFASHENGILAITLDENGNTAINDTSGKTILSMTSSGYGFQVGKDGMTLVKQWDLRDPRSFKGKIQLRLSKTLAIEFDCSDADLTMFFNCKGIKCEVSLSNGWSTLPITSSEGLKAKLKDNS